MSEKELQTSEIEVAPLAKADIEKLIPILEQHVRDRQTSAIIRNEIERITRWMSGEIDEDRQDVRHYLVARGKGGTILGCIALSSPDASMLAHFHTTPSESAEPLNLFVDREVWCTGVGRRLFEALCEVARVCGKRQLIANSGLRYQAAWTFHDMCFDQRCGLIFDKYGPQAHAMTWVKRFWSPQHPQKKR